MLDVTEGGIRFDTGVESCLAVLPAPPKFWSYSSLMEIDACPRRYALTRSSYPNLWERRGYPQLPTLPALFGDVVHSALETIAKAFIASGCESPKAAQAVHVLRQLDGYTAIVQRAVQERLAQLETNPRLSEERRRRLARDLSDQVSEARVQVQTYLSRSTFGSGGTPSPATETASHDASCRHPLEQRRAYAETPLASEDLRLMGRVDLLAVEEHGAEITDYKTGSKNLSHKEQLELYALLWNLDRVVNPERRPVARLTAAYPSHDITFPVPDESRMRELETMLATRIAAADAELSPPIPRAVPNEENCGHCYVRHLCDDYWSTMTPDPGALADGARFDCQGTVGAQNGARSWWLHREGTGQPKVLLRMQPTGPDLTTGSRVRILGLRIDKVPEVDATVASMTSFTEVFLRSAIAL